MYQDVYGHQGTNGMKGAVSQNKEDLDCLRESLTDKVGKKSVITIFAFIILPITVSKAVHGLALSIETSGNIVKVKNRKFEALQRLKDAGKCDDAYELYRELLPIIKGK
jgi:hypothetical protein